VSLRPRLWAAVMSVAILAVLSGCTTSAVHRVSAPLAKQSTTAPTAGAPSTTSSPSGTPTPEPTTAPPVNPVNLPPQGGRGPGGSFLTSGSDAVALTFDDGPDPAQTPRLLDLLAASGVKATFCLVGLRVRAYSALVKRIAAEGHTLCNHSWAHSLDLRLQSKEAILKDLADTNEAIRQAVPGVKIKYFRAPGGYFDAGLVSLASSLGMKSLYWSIDTRDWEFTKWGHGDTMVSHIIGIVQSQVRRGSVVLSHDFHKPDTIAAYQMLLPWLKANFKLAAMPV
jgi:peptidoglycan/xylan/chitin deacetylase (PgdA/CDA1 family)